MPRPREFDRDEVLDRAVEVFWMRGYDRTSVQDLVNSMGIQRGSLYATFGDKHHLFLEALDRYIVLVPVVPPIANPIRIESLLSEETCLTPEDTFAPETPTDVVGVSIDRGIFLTWDVVEVEDLAGYRVYRSVARTGPFELLNSVIVEEASYADETAMEGGTYYYSVTAVDSTKAANESGRSEVAEARRLSP